MDGTMPRSKTTEKSGRSSQKSGLYRDQLYKNDSVERAELVEAFALFDRNRNGCIEPNELRVVMETLGYKPSDIELRDMINEADMDGNCMIDFEEFVRLLKSRKKLKKRSEEDELKEAFKVSIDRLVFYLILLCRKTIKIKMQLP